MKKFSQFCTEAQDDTLMDTRKGVLNFITSNLYRFSNPDEKNNKALLMLVAALNVLNTASPDDTTAISTARRLAQMALVRSQKSKK